MDGSLPASSAFYRHAANRVPLAEATYWGVAYLMDRTFLANVFERYRGRSFEESLSFGGMLNLVSDALLLHGGFLLPALVAADENKEFEGTPQGVYGKLRRCPQSLSHGFLAEGAIRLIEVMNPLPSPIPLSLQDFEVLILDGKKIKKVAKRLKPTRSFQGSVLGGKVLAALDLETGMIRFMSSDQDGETNDVPLVQPLLEQMRLFPSDKPRLLVLDSQFCDLGLPILFDNERYSYLIRWSLKTSFERDHERGVKEGVNKEGQQYLDEWGWMGSKKDPRRRYVRRITVIRPGDVNVIVFTNLLDDTRYLATDLMALYLKRWCIESVFQQVTEVFHLKRLISCSPCGTIFQFAFCAMLYNQLILQRSYIVNPPAPEPIKPLQPTTTEAAPVDTAKESTAQKQTKPVTTNLPTAPDQPTITIEMFSMEKYFKDVVEELIAWNKIIPMHWTLDYFATPLTPAEMRLRMTQLLHGRWEPKWLKAPKKKFHPKKQDPPLLGGHTSIYRLIYGDPRTKRV